MVCILWQEEYETQIQETYEEYQNIEDIMKEIWKEYEDKDGRGSIQEISKTREDFQRSMVKICHEKSRSQHTFRRYDEDVFKAKYQCQKKNILVTSSRE